MSRTLVLIQSEGGSWTVVDGNRMSGCLQSDEALGMVAIALMTGRKGYPMNSFTDCEAALFEQRFRLRNTPEPTETAGAS